MGYKRCVLSIDFAQLMDAPALDDNHWLRTADAAWTNEIQASMAVGSAKLDCLRRSRLRRVFVRSGAITASGAWNRERS